jgi:H+/gluconate symporter-like permease
LQKKKEKTRKEKRKKKKQAKKKQEKKNPVFSFSFPFCILDKVEIVFTTIVRLLHKKRKNTLFLSFACFYFCVFFFFFPNFGVNKGSIL